MKSKSQKTHKNGDVTINGDDTKTDEDDDDEEDVTKYYDLRTWHKSTFLHCATFFCVFISKLCIDSFAATPV